jgi:hypothetical protein
MGMVAMIIHNVRDGRDHTIRSYEVEPLDYDALTAKDIGRTVIYRDHGRAEAGTLTSWRAGLVFAKYTSGDTSAASHPNDLSFAVDMKDSSL